MTRLVLLTLLSLLPAAGPLPTATGAEGDQPTENKPPGAGDISPAFEARTLDGKVLKLTDFKGRYVLLSFCAFWCGPCHADLKHLKQVHRKHAANRNFAMISLWLDPRIEDVRKQVERYHLQWNQVFLGDWRKQTLTRRYGVVGIPSVWLIGPDGRILARQMRGEETGRVVDQHLETAQPKRK